MFGLFLGIVNKSKLMISVTGGMLFMDVVSIYMVTFKNPLPVYSPSVENWIMSSIVIQDIGYDLLVMLLFYYFSQVLGSILEIFVAISAFTLLSDLYH